MAEQLPSGRWKATRKREGKDIITIKNTEEEAIAWETVSSPASSD